MSGPSQCCRARAAARDEVQFDQVLAGHGHDRGRRSHPSKILYRIQGWFLGRNPAACRLLPAIIEVSARLHNAATTPVQAHSISQRTAPRLRRGDPRQGASASVRTGARPAHEESGASRDGLRAGRLGRPGSWRRPTGRCAASREARVTELDDRTKANLDVVLKEVCRPLPHGGDHEICARPSQKS